MNLQSNPFWLQRSLSLLGSLVLSGGSLLSLPSLAQTSEEIPAETKVELQAPKVLSTSETAVTSLDKPAGHSSPLPTLSSAGKNNYVDNNSYTLQSPRPYNPPRQVIVSDRSQGCQTVAENGTLNGGSCGGAARPTARPAIARKVIASRRLVALQPTKAVSKAAVQPIKAQTRSARPLRRLTAPVSAPLEPATVSLNPLQINGVSLALAPIHRHSTNAAISQEDLAPIYERATRMSGAGLNQARRTDLLFPLALPSAISSAFGWRTHPITGNLAMHQGTDLAAPEGTPVLASYPGQVAQADWVGGYGLMVTLRHLDGKQESRYAHLSEIYVRTGEEVEQGAVIGRVGSTGFSTGPHLHFEWRHLTEQGWVAVDAGLHLEYALENLWQRMQLAQQTAAPGLN